MHPAEAYILSRFRNKYLAQEVAANQGISKHVFDALVHTAEVEFGLNTPGYSTDVYNEAFGEPLCEQILRIGDTTEAFAGSIRRVYKLKSFEHVLFTANQHPDGYAWGEVFIQSHLPNSYVEDFQVEPFELTKDSLVNDSRVVGYELFDGWGRSEDIYIDINDKFGRLKTYYAEFDYKLLQVWKPQQRPLRHKNLESV